MEAKGSVQMRGAAAAATARSAQNNRAAGEGRRWAHWQMLLCSRRSAGHGAETPEASTTITRSSRVELCIRGTRATA